MKPLVYIAGMWIIQKSKVRENYNPCYAALEKGEI